MSASNSSVWPLYSSVVEDRRGRDARIGAGSRSPRRWQRRLAVWLASGLPACGDGGFDCAAAQCESGDIHVATWWGEDRDLPANTFQDAAQRQPFVGNVTWNGGYTREELGRLLRDTLFADEPAPSPHPIDVFLANGGLDVLRWTTCGAGRDLLVPLDEYYDFGDIDPAILLGVSCGTKTFAAPAGLHRVNYVVRRRDRAEAMASAEVVDLPSFERMARENPLVVSLGCGEGARDPAGESLQFLVEGLVLLQGSDTYERLWAGRGASDGSPLLRALESIRALHGAEHLLFDPDRTTAVGRIARGEASFMVMPDWFVTDKGVTEAMEGAPLPGTADVYLFSTDVFAIPKPRAPSDTTVEAGLRFLDQVMTPRLQNEFAYRKRALPALHTAYDLPNRFENPKQLLGSMEHELGRPQRAIREPAVVRGLLMQWALGFAATSCPDRSPAGPSAGCEGLCAERLEALEQGSCGPAGARRQQCVDRAFAEAIEAYLTPTPTPRTCPIAADYRGGGGAPCAR